MGKKEEKKTALALADYGTIYVKSHEGCLMRPVKAEMILSMDKGHVYLMKKTPIITSGGYKHLNKVASINLVTPQSVIVDGRKENNPYVERNKNTRAIDAVACRKIGVGFSPLGNITVIDKTLFYNVYTYLIQSIQAKMKRIKYGKDGKPTKDKLFPDCAKIGTEDDKPTKGKWVFYETAAPLGIWANYEDQAIIEVLEDHTQRQRFGDRIAQTICERNILRDHPAIAISQIKLDSNGEAKVIVYGWRSEMGPSDVQDVMDQAEAGAQTIDVKKEIIDVTPEEEEEARETEEKSDKSPAEMEEPPEDYKSKDAPLFEKDRKK